MGVLRSPAVAWGFDPSSGCLITTYDAKVGRFGGAQVGQELAPRKLMSSNVARPLLKIAVVCDIPPHATNEDAVLAGRAFRASLHPLEAPREYPLHLRAISARTVHAFTGSRIVKPSSLAFSINDGELQPTSVQLPTSGVYPWVLMSGEGDQVELVSVTKIGGYGEE